MRLALVSTPLAAVPQAFQGSRQSEEPLDLMYSAGLSLVDVETRLCDPNVSDEAAWVSSADAIVMSTTNSYLQWNNHPMGLQLFTDRYEQVKSLVGTSTPVVVFGPHVPAFHEDIFDLGASAVILGEGELEAPKVAVALAQDKDVASFGGLMKRAPDPRPLPVIVDVNELPSPAYDQTAVKAYNAHNHPAGLSNGHLYEASRGCYYQCSFCNTITHRRSYRTKTPQNVDKDLRFLLDHSDKSYVYLIDESFGAAKNWTREVLELMRKLPLTFGCQGNLSFLDKDKLEHMSSAGFINIEFGYETANEGVIRTIGKNNKLSKSGALLNYACQLGLSPLLFTQVGLPGETKQTLGENIEFLRGLDSRVRVSIAMTTPYRETELWKAGVQAGIIPLHAKGEKLYDYTGRIGHNLDFSKLDADHFLQKYGPNNFLTKAFIDQLESDVMDLFQVSADA